MTLTGVVCTGVDVVEWVWVEVVGGDATLKLQAHSTHTYTHIHTYIRTYIPGYTSVLCVHMYVCTYLRM